MKPRTLWLVRTRFGFVELFLGRPHVEGPHWAGRCIYVFDPLTVWALGLRRLAADEPSRMTCLAERHQCPWRFVKVNQDQMRIDRRVCGIWIHIISFCDRMIQAVGLDDIPNGAVVFPTFE